MAGQLPHPIRKPYSSCGRSLGSAPRKNRLRLPSIGQVSRPEAQQQVRTPRPRHPSDRSTGPRCSLRAVLLGLPRLPRACSWEDGRTVTGSSSAPSAPMALPVSARPALRAPFSSGGGRGNPRRLRRPWMEADEGKQTQAPVTHRHDGKQEEKVRLLSQGLMGQEAGPFPRLTSEMRERKRGASGAA